MDPTTYKTITTQRGYSYSYYISATKGQKETLLLLHGFPEYADMWADQVAAFEAAGHTCIAPDLLGYGATSKPVDGEAYNSEGLAQDVADILDVEGSPKVIVIGHDWGSYLAGRFANWQAARVTGLVVTSVAYRPASELQLDAANAQMKSVLGYEPFGYWGWIAAPGSAAVLEEHIDSLFSLLFAKDAEIWKTDFTPAGKLQEWLAQDRHVEEAEFITPEIRAELLRKWKEDGFDGKLGWYRAMTENTHWNHEKNIDAARFKLSIPVLFIGGSRDAPAPAALGDLVTKPLCENYTGKVIDSGHWMLREKPAEWLATVQDWLKEKF